VYKTYIDVVHIAKDETSQLFSLFSEDQSQSQGQEGTQEAAAGGATQSQAPAHNASNLTREEMDAKREEFRVRARCFGGEWGEGRLGAELV
jgi:hypothetical protein